jgi:hypothetical protein
LFFDLKLNPGAEVSIPSGYLREREREREREKERKRFKLNPGAYVSSPSEENKKKREILESFREEQG